MQESEKQKVIQSEEIKLSAMTTGLSQVIGIAFIPISIAILYLICIADRKPDTNVIFSVGYFLLGSAAMTAFIVYLLKKMVKARLVGRKLFFKRIFSAEQELDVSNILILNTIAMSSTRYLKVTYKTKDDDKSKTFWIAKPGLFSGTSDIETIVEFSRRHYREYKAFK